MRYETKYYALYIAKNEKKNHDYYLNWKSDANEYVEKKRIVISMHRYTDVSK